jgi:hypothetical protein
MAGYGQRNGNVAPRARGDRAPVYQESQCDKESSRSAEVIDLRTLA